MPGWRLPKVATTSHLELLGLFNCAELHFPSLLAGTFRVSISAALTVNRANGINPAIMVSGLSNESLEISWTAAIEQMLMGIQRATKALPFALIAAVIVLIVGQSGSSATA